jgi:ABC-type transport system involved in cytochrome c biogenesis permease subunit
MTEEFETPMPAVKEPPMRNNTLVAILVVVLFLFLCCCCTLMGILGYFYTYGDQIFGLTSQLLLQLAV